MTFGLQNDYSIILRDYLLRDLRITPEQKVISCAWHRVKIKNEMVQNVLTWEDLVC